MWIHMEFSLKNNDNKKKKKKIEFYLLQFWLVLSELISCIVSRQIDSRLYKNLCGKTIIQNNYLQ